MGLTPTHMRTNFSGQAAGPSASAMLSMPFDLRIAAIASPMGFPAVLDEIRTPVINIPASAFDICWAKENPANPRDVLIWASSRRDSASLGYSHVTNWVPSNCRSASPISFCWSGLKFRGAISASSFKFAAFSSCACFSNSAARTSALPAAFPALTPSFFASSTLTAASLLYCASSIADCAISALCNFTTNHVESPAINPDTPTMSSEPRIKSSQPWSEKPQIIFTLFDKVVVGIVLFSMAGMLVIGGLFFRNAWRNFRC